MRSLLVLSLLLVACDDNTTANNNHDLSSVDQKPVDGCFSFDKCLTTCAQQNPGDDAGYMTCANACATHATDNAVTLWVQAYFVCPATKFCGPGHMNDAGVQPCSSADLDPKSTAVSDACNACLKDAYKNMAAAVNAMCMSDIQACTNDKP